MTPSATVQPKGSEGKPNAGLTLPSQPSTPCAPLLVATRTPAHGHPRRGLAGVGRKAGSRVMGCRKAGKARPAPLTLRILGWLWQASGDQGFLGAPS